MTTVPQTLDRAVRSHRAGNLQEAAQLYQQILQVNPQHVNALHLLGLIFHQVGKNDLASAYISQALRLAPRYAEGYNNLGVVLQQQGQLAEAMACYQQALHLEPNYAEAHHNLGNVFRTQGQLAEAVTCYRHAVRLKPSFAEAHQSLGLALRKQGELAEAVVSYQQALHLKPTDTEAHHNLGNALSAQGKLAEAVASYQQALRLKPTCAQTHHNLGVVLQQQGRLEEAVASFQQVLRLNPNGAAAHHGLGMALRQQGKLVEAVASYQQALRLEPNCAEAHHNLGVALRQQGQLEEAVARFQQAHCLEPTCAEAHHNLGVALLQQGQLTEALASSEQALRLKPNLAAAHLNVGSVLTAQRKAEQAVVRYQQALRSDPELVEAHINLANTYKELGKLEEAATCYQHALRLKPSPSLRLECATLLPPIYTSTEEISAWRARLEDHLAQLHREHTTVDLTREPAHPLFYLAYQGLNDRDLQRTAARLYTAPPAPSGRRATSGRSRDGRVKVGFVSRYLRDHTIGELFRGTLAQLRRDALAVTVFSLGRYRDPTAQFLKEHVESYVELPEDLAVARQRLAEHELDVLVYPDIGMEELSYSLAFSRLAPVQCALWGHPVTTGIDTIDYFLSSEHLEIPEAQEHYTETLVRLPVLPVYFYRPVLPTPLQGRAAFGLPEDGHLYGCPQSLFKLHPDFDPLLREILRRDPKGILVLLQGTYPSWTETLRKRLATTLGAAAERVVFVDRLSQPAFLNLNALLDVLLDPVHFGGGRTSYEALAFGVPIVTLPSPYLRGRITLALYQQMQVLECVAGNTEEYVERAVRLGTDPDYRAQVRAQILEASGVLYENRAGVRALEAFLLSAKGTQFIPL